MSINNYLSNIATQAAYKEEAATLRAALLRARTKEDWREIKQDIVELIVEGALPPLSYFSIIRAE